MTPAVTTRSARRDPPRAAARAADARVGLIDVSFDLADRRGERRYRDAHLPGSHYLHLDAT